MYSAIDWHGLCVVHGTGISSLNSIFANIGISLGSFTAAETVHYLSLGSVGYVAAVYGLLTVLVITGLSRRYRNAYPY